MAYNYGLLKADVASALGRDDVPDYVYRLAVSDINTDLRVSEMLFDQTLTASGEETDFTTDVLEVDSIYVDTNPRIYLTNISDQSTNLRHVSSGQPVYYSLTEVDGTQKLRLMPVPDGSYSIVVRGYAARAQFEDDTGTNRVLTTFPGVYLYACLRHAAIWAQDLELAGKYEQTYAAEIRRAHKKDRMRRFNGPLVKRAVVPN